MENKQISDLLQLDQSPVRDFRRALRSSDQAAFDDLFLRIREHAAAIKISGRTSTIETIILAMLLEEHKEVTRLRRLVEEDLNFGSHI
jgi:hypothetical protein